MGIDRQLYRTILISEHKQRGLHAMDLYFVVVSVPAWGAAIVVVSSHLSNLPERLSQDPAFLVDRLSGTSRIDALASTLQTVPAWIGRVLASTRQGLRIVQCRQSTSGT